MYWRGIVKFRLGAKSLVLDHKSSPIGGILIYCLGCSAAVFYNKMQTLCTTLVFAPSGLSYYRYLAQTILPIVLCVLAQREFCLVQTNSAGSLELYIPPFL